MFYYLHLLLLAPLYSLLSSLLGRDQNRGILLLRQQLLILQRQLVRKPAHTQAYCRLPSRATRKELSVLAFV